jgi:histidine ammonia-lyase
VIIYARCILRARVIVAARELFILFPATALEHFRPLKSTPALETVLALVRSAVPPLKVRHSMKPCNIKTLTQDTKLDQSMHGPSQFCFLCFASVSLKGDRFMAPDIEAVAELVRSGKVAGAVELFLK